MRFWFIVIAKIYWYLLDCSTIIMQTIYITNLNSQLSRSLTAKENKRLVGGLCSSGAFSSPYFIQRLLARSLPQIVCLLPTLCLCTVFFKAI